MIRDGIRDMEHLSHQVSGLRQAQQHGQALARRQSSVGSLLERAVLARTASDVLSARLDAAAPNQLPASAAAARLRIDDWVVALDDDLAAALAGDSFAELNDVVLKAIGDLESQASQLWKRYVLHHAPRTSADILEALEHDPRARVAVVRIRRLSDQLTGLRNRSVPTRDDIDKFDQTARELHEAWATLDVESIAPEVVAFLRAANSDRGAAISSLTPGVLAWLEARGATNQYVVKPAD